VSAEAQKQAAHPSSRLPIRAVKILAGIAVVAIFGWMPLRTLLQTSSVEAIVNSRVVTVRAPIAGEVTDMSAGLAGAAIIEAREPLLTIANMRADRARLDALDDRLAERRIARTAIAAKIAATERAHDLLAREVESFTASRIAQLEARIAVLMSEISAAGARREQAVAAAERGASLALFGAVAGAERDRLRRERTVAEQAAVAAHRQLDMAEVELAAARAGTFVGDSYNDRPSSAQRRDELKLRIEDLVADLAAAEAEISSLERRIVEENVRHRNLAQASVSLPVAGRVFEVMTAPGEQVRAGQDLLKILDCSGAVVTANVTEAVYNRLSVGERARFSPTDGGRNLDGIVSNLTGLAEAPANLAITPAALAGEAYRVTVKVPELANGDTCAIGRTGRVIFDGTAGPPSP
jgi:multidrug resistance efflux pump